MSVLTPQKVNTAGLSLVAVAAGSGGDQIPAGPGRILEVINGSGASINVILNSIKSCDQGFDHDVTVAVPAGTTRFLGPFSDRYVDSTGMVNITYSAVTTVTVASLEV